MTQPILVVDDEPQFRTLIRIVLQRNGYDVIEAANAQSALDLICTTMPSVVIVDIMMPETDGIELCRQLRNRADTVRLPVIMMSTIHDHRRIRSGYDAGANEFLSKTTLHPDLPRKIRQLLEPQQAAAS